MVDTVNLLLTEQLGEVIAQFLRCVRIFAERLLDYNPIPASVDEDENQTRDYDSSSD